MDVSIVVPTYNGEAVIQRLLASLASAVRSAGLTWEVIVVNNNSSDKTEDVVAKPCIRFGFGMRVKQADARHAEAGQRCGHRQDPEKHVADFSNGHRATEHR